MAGTKGRSGRKSQATAIKERNGTFIKDPQRRNKNELKPKTGTPKKPRSVSADKVANAKWIHVTETLADLGVLTVADELEAYCLNESQLVASLKEMKKSGIDKNGRTTPATVQWNKCMDRRIKLMSELGLTTSARTRLAASPQDENDPFLEYLEKRAGKG